MIRNPWFRWSVLAAFFFALGFTYEYHLPQIETFFLAKVEEISAKKAPAQITPKSLKLTLFPLGVVLENVRVLPKRGLEKTLAPLELKEVAIGLNIWSLIRGDIRLSRVILRNSSITVFLKQSLFESKPGGGGKRLSMDALKDVPLDELILENMTVTGRVDPQGLLFRVSQLDLDVVNLYNSIYLYAGSPNWQFKPAGPFPTLNLEAQARGLADANELRISALKIKSGDSFLVASGLLAGDFLQSQLSAGRFSLRTHIALENVASWLRVLPNPPSVPKLAGLLNLDADVLYKGQNQKPDLHLNVDSKGLQIDQFKLGDVSGKMLVHPGDLHSDEVVVRNSSGAVKLKAIDLAWKPDVSLSANVDVNNIELHEFLETIGVHGVPVHLNVDASGVQCKTINAGRLELQCNGGMQATDLVVTNDSGKKVIVKAKTFKGHGQVNVNSKDVRYKAEVEGGAKSKGRSQGVIDYDKGFQISYQSDHLDFGDIENLVDLKLQGSASLEGTTTGTSDWATLSMNVKTKDFWLEDFGVGNLTSTMAYKKGHLTFTGAEGQFGVSRYSGFVDIDLLKEQITAQSKMIFVDLKDLQQLLSRQLPIPVALTGTGAGQIKAFGPLNFEKLNYQVSSEFFRGTIAGETFDSLRFDVDAEKGVARTRRVQLTKAYGQLDMRGVLRPGPWMVDSVIVGHGLRLEQSEIVNSFGLDLQGQADFNLVTRGALKRPTVELNGRLSKVVVADSPQDDSSFRLNFTGHHLTGSGQFLGDKVQSQFIFPLDPKSPFALELKTKNWDFTNLFSIISKSANRADFQTSLSMEAKLHSDEGGFWNSNGVVDVKEFSIRHAAEFMMNKGPMRLIFNKGTVTSENFTIGSGDNFLKLRMYSFTREHLNADLNGKMNLGLLGLLAPFISDLRGQLALNVDLKGSVDKPVMSGSAFIEKAYVKLRDFPHPASNLRADLLFNQQTLMLNAFRADVAGGKLTGDGHLTVAGEHSVPVEVKGSFTDVNLNFPEGYKTHGSGTIAIQGEHFPYNMAIRYDVTGGEIVAEFQSDKSAGQSVKASPYLPKFVTQDSFEPFIYDVDLTLKKPISVSNTLLKAQVQGKCLAKGRPSALLLNGNFSVLPGGKVFVRDNGFDITNAYVEYANYPPENPRIYLTATGHASEVVTDQQHFETPSVGAQAGQAPIPREEEVQYDINLVVQGRAQPMPQITLTSQPPLSQREIVSLLALGMTPTALDQQKSSASANTALGAALLQQPVGKKLKESLGVDVRVSTAPPTGADPTAAPMVTFSKQWTPKFNASMSSTFGQTQSSGVKLEYKVGHGTSVIGSWEDRQQSTTVFEGQQNVNPSIFGLDLEYKFQFK